MTRLNFNALSLYIGVSCDLCMKSNFSGKRYKCLICYDFDLCSNCHDQSVLTLTNTAASTTASKSNAIPQKTPNIPLNNNNHANTHPMQCILTKSDFELFYGSNIIDFVEQSSFTCPYCGKLGFSEATLCEHITVQHPSTSNTTATTTSGANYSIQEVVCPICAALPSGSGGDPNHLTDDLLQHINVEHLNNRNLEDNLLIDNNNTTTTTTNLINNNFGTASAVAAAAALRFSRRLNYSQNTLRASAAGSGGSTSRNLISNGSSGSGRYALQFGNGSSSGIGSGLSSFMRSTSAGLESMLSGANSMDPIAELLSQLTGVRRAAASSQSTNLQLQQLQAQLNREREHLQNQSASLAAAAAAAGSTGIGGSRAGHQHHSLGHHLFSSSGGSGSNASKTNPFNSIKNMSNAPHHGSVSAAQASNAAAAAASQTASNLTNAMHNQILELPQNLFLQPVLNNSRDSRYLLAKYVEILVEDINLISFGFFENLPWKLTENPLKKFPKFLSPRISPKYSKNSRKIKY